MTAPLAGGAAPPRLDAPPGDPTGHRLGPYPLLLPRLHDPHLVQSAVLLTLQVLGQTTLGFPLSVPQIAVSLLTCALIEVAITFWRRRIIMWPASALLTGNGVALLLRDPATRAGEHWSTQALGLFAGVAAVSILSKHLLRFAGGHVFNPSNLGLVGAFLLLGAERADAQFLYWGPWRPGLAAAVVLIVGGALLVGRRAGVLAIGATFLLALGAGLGLVAGSGHCMVAAWSAGPVCGAEWWWRVAASPETLVFAAFMITDPRTVPSGRGARIGFAVAAAALAVLFSAPQHTEFATKVAVLAGLTAASGGLLGLRLAARWAGRGPRAATLAPRPNPLAAPAGRGPSPLGSEVVPPSRRRGLPTPRVPDLRLVAAAAGLLLLWVVAVLSLAGRADDLRAAPLGASAERALPAWPAGLDPPIVATAPDVGRWSPWFRPGDAEARARAVVADLEARRRAADGAAVVYVRVEALMVRVPASRQDTPEIGVAVTTRSAGGDGSTTYHRLESAGDSFVVAGDAEPWVDPPASTAATSTPGP